jgi:glycosyltransferase involved in cell wall biosynthesis
MRVVTVLTSLGVGGAEKQALAVAERMAKRGHEVAVLVLRAKLQQEWPTALPVVHLDIYGIRENPLSLVMGWRRARVFLRDFRPDVLHSHSFHANLLARLLQIGVPAGALAGASRTAVISTVHNVYEGGWARMMAYRLTDGWSDRTVAVSGAAAERFVRLKAIPTDKCRVRANGIDSAEFTPVAERRTTMRRAMGANSAFIWLSAGRVMPAKDFPNLLRAFAMVRGEAPDTELWIAGALQDAKEALAADGLAGEVLTAGAERSGPERVRWLGLRRDMPALMDAADGFVLASAWEGMPLVLGEAMAMEKPVVATDVGGVGELVGDCGAIVPAKDSEALAAAMLETMRRSREERAQMGRLSRERIVREFSIDAAADWWEALYEQPIGSRKTPAP